MVTRSENSLVLFESPAKKLTNDVGSLIGKELKLDDNRVYYITGILKDPPENSYLARIKQFFFLLGNNPAANNMIISSGTTQRNTYYIQLYKNASKRDFLTKTGNFFSEDKTENPYTLQPFTGLSNFSEYNINILKFLFIFGLLILLSTLSNFILFQISLYYNRLKEYGIRIVTGVDGRQFTMQLFVDVAIKFLFSCFIVFFVMESFFPVFEKTYYELTYLHLHLPILRGHLMNYFVYGLLLSLLFSSILSRNLLKLSSRSVFGNLLRKNNRNIANSMLLFIQLAIITVFISAAGIVKLQLDSMRSDIFSNLTQDERENIVSFPCAFLQLRDLHNELSQKIIASKDVLDVTYTDVPVIRMMLSTNSMKINGIDDLIVRRYQVALNFFDFFNGHTLLGDASESAVNNGEAVVVNKNFMKMFPDESIIGKTFEYELDNRTYRVVGVIDNVQLFLINFNEGQEEVNNIVEKEVLFFKRIPIRLTSCNYYVKFKSGKLKETKQHIDACLKEFIPDGYEVEFETLQETVDSTFKSEKLISYSSATLLLVSLILGLLNVYSSVLMSVEKRRKEIAIRKIHGAGLKDIIVLMGKRYFISWTLACIISFPFIYFYAMRWLERYKEPVNLNLLLFVANYAVILILIALTVISQIVKTAKSNPAETINKE